HQDGQGPRPDSRRGSDRPAFVGQPGPFAPLPVQAIGWLARIAAATTAWPSPALPVGAAVGREPSVSALPPASSGRRFAGRPLLSFAELLAGRRDRPSSFRVRAVSWRADPARPPGGLPAP